MPADFTRHWHHLTSACSPPDCINTPGDTVDCIQFHSRSDISGKYMHKVQDDEQQLNGRTGSNPSGSFLFTSTPVVFGSTRRRHAVVAFDQLMETMKLSSAPWHEGFYLLLSQQRYDLRLGLIPDDSESTSR
ncbi:unnamed protein product [Pleuronectes platessa]|uniref:Uncharacterized protein n=1 Tax=Pleuronectes platessa TaxID=8262 RepID=A0A9N7YEK4_PLEPL|nr:unnamed protein product [Pleuronectes platessa]